MAEKQKYTVHQTQFELSPASNEQGFCFTHFNSPVDRACIGHLRGDFGETGTGFYHTWWPHNAHLITPSFNIELKDVLTGLRQNGLLRDRKTMLARSMRFRTAIIPTEGRNTMAFRIETQEHLFYLRCIPNKGEYNFYCYGYNKTMLMEVLRQQKQLPRIAWAELDSSHEVVAICYGESGYYHYLYLFGKVQKRRTSSRKTHFLLWEDFRTFERYKQQAQFLWQNRIQTTDDLHQKRQEVTAKMDGLVTRRQALYKLRSNTANGLNKADLSQQIQALTEELRGLRKKLR